jgi:hypothetical protein
MGESVFQLQANTLNWLLEENNPSVRYYTLLDILDRPESDFEVVNTKKAIMTSKIVSNILSKQNKQGYWETPQRFYTAKYKGTVWQLIILAELGAHGEDEHIKKACEFILETSLERKSGGFSIRTSKAGGAPGGIIPCLTGNMLWSLIRFGYLEDSRVRRGIDWITTYQRFDDAVQEPVKGWPYDQWEICWGKHTCHMGVVKSLKALSEIAVDERTEAIHNTIEYGTEFMLRHHIHKRSHNLNRLSKPGWKRFGFPLMYQTDVLEILRILTKLGYRDSRMQEAVDLLISKQDNRGRWKLENTYNGRYQIDIEQKDKTSKWITLHALKVLKRLQSVP